MGVVVRLDMIMVEFDWIEPKSRNTIKDVTLTIKMVSETLTYANYFLNKKGLNVVCSCDFLYESFSDDPYNVMLTLFNLNNGLDTVVIDAPLFDVNSVLDTLSALEAMAIVL